MCLCFSFVILIHARLTPYCNSPKITAAPRPLSTVLILLSSIGPMGNEKTQKPGKSHLVSSWQFDMFPFIPLLSIVLLNDLCCFHGLYPLQETEGGWMTGEITGSQDACKAAAVIVAFGCKACATLTL